MNKILTQIRQTRDDLAHETGYDLQPLFDYVREREREAAARAAQVHLPRTSRKRNRLLAARGTAQAKTTTMKTNLAVMAVRRRQLEHVTAGEYPWTDPANAGMRRKCDLPLDRLLNP